MKIVRAELTPFAPQFVDGETCVMSIYAQSALDNGLLTITTDTGLTGTGLTGTGEVARFSAFA